MNPLGSQSNTHFWPSAEIALVLTLVFGLLALWKPNIGSGAFQKIERALSRFAERKTLVTGLMFLGVTFIRLAVLPLLPTPIPGIHDEFSYLLMADTFTHGRLANPTHPMWMSFETFHVNWFPTYASMYPPAQGFVMAIGQSLGNPWFGVLLSDAAMCAAILWMLQAWMPGAMGVAGRRICCVKFGNRQLLDEQLLGRSGCGNRRSTCPRWTGAYPTSRQCEQCPAARAGRCDTRE